MLDHWYTYIINPSFINNKSTKKIICSIYVLSVMVYSIGNIRYLWMFQPQIQCINKVWYLFQVCIQFMTLISIVSAYYTFYHKLKIHHQLWVVFNFTLIISSAFYMSILYLMHQYFNYYHNYPIDYICIIRIYPTLITSSLFVFMLFLFCRKF